MTAVDINVGDGIITDQGPTAADSGALASDRRQGAARTASPVADHRSEQSAPALPRDATGRFTARPALPLCAGCGRVLFENLRAELLCPWPTCELARQVVGHTGADAGVLAS